jgi:aryl-alcohol dehydrogenase-like predicted oxidoreductase
MCQHFRQHKLLKMKRSENHVFREACSEKARMALFRASLDNLSAIRELLQTGGGRLSQGALGWLMAKSDRNIPLPGARTVEQIQENAGAIGLGPLPTDVITEIEVLIHRDPEGEARAL